MSTGSKAAAAAAGTATIKTNANQGKQGDT